MSAGQCPPPIASRSGECPPAACPSFCAPPAHSANASIRKKTTSGHSGLGRASKPYHVYGFAHQRSPAQPISVSIRDPGHSVGSERALVG